MLRVCTSSTESALMSLTVYKATLGTTSTADDVQMQYSLDRATALIEGYLGYPLKRQVYAETVAGYGSLELQVSRTPLRAIESIFYTTDEVDPTSYDIANESAGLIYRELGWPWTAGVEYDLVPHVVPRSELKSYTVVYEAGYCVNGSTEPGWLTTGEPVPGDIEGALVNAATFLYKSAGRDLSITSKRIGDLSLTYQGGGVQGGSQSMGLPEVVKGMLSHYRRF
jgi:hypothetical protein